MEIIILFFWLFLIICFLVGKLSYEYGKKEQWQEIARDYICFHKSVKIKPLIVTVDYVKEKANKQVKKSCAKGGKKNKN